jgi:DDE family transposase
MAKIVTSDYAQMLLNGVDNFTATYFSEVIGTVSHDTIGRSIASIKLSPKVVREKALELIVPSANGYLALDDSVMDKGSSEKIETASAQYSGQKHGITTGIGVVTLVYINPELNKYWILDYRIYDKATDGKKKTEHALEMIQYWQTIHELHPGRAPFTTVLIDAGYTSKKIMQYIVRKEKIFYGVMPKSRKVSYPDPTGQIDETTGKTKIIYKHVGDLDWDAKTNEGIRLRTFGITVCIEDLPNDKPLRLFRMTAKHRTEYIVTNDVRVETAEAAKQVGSFRWRIEQFHREVKQLTGVAKCQARKGRKQRNHICIAFVVWHQLHELAEQMQTTMYEVKHIPLREYQKQLWRNPAYTFALSDFA